MCIRDSATTVARALAGVERPGSAGGAEQTILPEPVLPEPVLPEPVLPEPVLPGAVLLYPYLDSVGAEGIFATLTGGPARRYDDLAVLTTATLGFALGVDTVEG